MVHIFTTRSNSLAVDSAQVVIARGAWNGLISGRGNFLLLIESLFRLPPYVFAMPTSGMGDQC